MVEIPDPTFVGGSTCKMARRSNCSFPHCISSEHKPEHSTFTDKAVLLPVAKLHLFYVNDVIPWKFEIKTQLKQKVKTLTIG